MAVAQAQVAAQVEAQARVQKKEWELIRVAQYWV